jgi:hypothetical protein
VQVLTDHANLQYYRHPQKINRRVARYISFLEDFNYQLKHIPGIKNRANALSRRPDHNDRSDDNNQVVALLDEVFVKAISVVTLDEEIRRQQRRDRVQIKGWKDKYHLSIKSNGAWYKGGALVVTGDDENH